jgi:hypothetical protein
MDSRLSETAAKTTDWGRTSSFVNFVTGNACYQDTALRVQEFGVGCSLL